jgi:hypothetical protein
MVPRLARHLWLGMITHLAVSIRWENFAPDHDGNEEAALCAPVESGVGCVLAVETPVTVDDKRLGRGLFFPACAWPHAAPPRSSRRARVRVAAASERHRLQLAFAGVRLPAARGPATAAERAAARNGAVRQRYGHQPRRAQAQQPSTMGAMCREGRAPAQRTARAGQRRAAVALPPRDHARLRRCCRAALLSTRSSTTTCTSREKTGTEYSIAC